MQKMFDKLVSGTSTSTSTSRPKSSIDRSCSVEFLSCNYSPRRSRPSPTPRRATSTRYDYSGYEQSSGKPSEQNTYADIETAYKCLIDNYGVKEEEIILYGQSVGTGPTVDLASHLPHLRAVVLHSPILSEY